jgi:hypothetical protein
MIPLILLPLILAAAGSATAAMAQNRVNRKQQSIADYYRNKNLSLRKQAMAQVNPAIDQYGAGDIAAKMQKSEDDRNRVLIPEKAPGSDVDYTGSAPEATRRNISRRIIDTIKTGREETARLNKISSYGDAMYGNRLATIRPRDMVSMLGNFAQGNSNLVPMEMDQAQHAGDNLNLISDLFKMGSQMSSMYMATGKPMASGAPATSGNWRPGMVRPPR